MNTLEPREIKTIVDSLDKKSVWRCLTINKAWYTVCIAYVLRRLVFTKATQLIKLVHILSSVHQRREIRHYTTHLDISRAPIDHRTFIVTLNLATHFPNLEYLFVPTATSIIRCLVDRRNSSVARLKYLHFYKPKIKDMSDVMTCYQQYSHTLVYMDLSTQEKYDGLDHKYLRLSVLPMYLNYFDQLEYLIFKPHGFLFDGGFLPLIIQSLLKLKKLSYTGNLLNYSKVNECSPRPALVFADIEVTIFTMKDALYIRNIFTHLRDLTLLIKGSVNNLYNIISMLIKIPSLQTLSLRAAKLKIYQVKKGLTAFWEYADVSTERVFEPRNTAEFVVNLCENEMDLSMVKDPSTGTKRMNSYTSLASDDNFSYEIFLNKLGRYLHKVEIPYSPYLDANTIVQACPYLVHLTYRDIEEFSKPFYHLSRLTFTLIDNWTLRAVQSSFPNLKTLDLDMHPSTFRFCKGVIYYLQLPETGLEELVVSYKMSLGWKLVVRREVSSFRLFDWYVCPKTNRLIKDPGDGVVEMLRQETNKKICVLRSSTLTSLKIKEMPGDDIG